MFDLIPASTQRFTIPATVVTLDSTSISLDLYPDFAPADAAVWNIIDVMGVRYRLYHLGPNQWGMAADGYTKTFAVTSLWSVGQRVHVKATWIKTGNVLTLAINGTEITPSVGAGAWGTTDVGATLYIGSRYDGVGFYDGDLGNLGVWDRALTAGETTALAGGQAPLEAAPSGLKFASRMAGNDLPDYNPGGEVLTTVNSPLPSQTPLCQRAGARAMVEGFQSATGTFELPGWTLTGTPTADTLIEQVAAPAGTDVALGAQVLHVKHLATENAIYHSKTIASLSAGYCQFYYRATTQPAGSAPILQIRHAGGLLARFSTASATQFSVAYHNGSTLVTAATQTMGMGRWYQITIAWDVTAQTFRVWLDGVSIASVSTPLAAAVTLCRFGWDTTSYTGEYHLAGLDIRSDRRPDALYDGAWDLDGTADYITAPQALATAIQDEGAVVMRVRPDFLPAEGTLRQLFSVAEGANYLRCSFSATANRIYLYNNARSGYGASTSLWAAGQWVQVVAQWKKSTDALEVYINGTSLGSLTKAGTWGAEAVSSALALGATSAAGDKLDGAIGRMAVYPRLLSAAEIADHAKGIHPADVSARQATALQIAYYEPGNTANLIGDATYLLTKVGAPAVVRGPGSQEGRGAVLARTSFEGTGFEQSGWTVVEAGGSLVDEDLARPAGSPAYLGNQACRIVHVDGEAADSISRTIGASAVDTVYVRKYMRVAVLPAGTCVIARLYTGAADTAWLTVSSAGMLSLVCHIAAGDQTAPLSTLRLGQEYCVEYGYSIARGIIGYRFGGRGAWTETPAVLDRGGAVTFYAQSGATTSYNIDYTISGLEIRTDRWPGSLPLIDSSRNGLLLLGV